MSHFVLGVFLEDCEDFELKVDSVGGLLDEVLAPYSEHLEVEPYPYKTREEVLEEFTNAIKEIEEGDESNFFVERNKEHNILGMNVEEFGKWYYGEDLVGGCAMTTYNPESKWDWWVIGGRWDGLLKLKDGTRVNYAKVKDLDLSIDKEIYEDSIRFWELVVEEQPLREGEGQPFNFYKPEYYTDQYGTKEQYATEQAKLNVFAFIHEDEWFEKGNMGWFGVSDATKDSTEEFRNKFWDVLENIDPESYLVVVDCHI